MEMMIDFPQNVCVDAHFAGFTVKTDQGAPVGDGSAPAPFGLFLASIGTCAGFYVLSFCQHRGLSTENIRIIQRSETNPATRMIERITLEIQVPPAFPEKYHAALVRAADQCAVKKHLEQPPMIEVATKVV